MKEGKSFVRNRMQEMEMREISKLNLFSSLIQSEQFPSNSDVRIFSSRKILPAGVKQSGLRTEKGYAEVHSRYSFRNQGCNNTINSCTSYLTQNGNGHHEGNVLKRRSVLTEPVKSWILEKSMRGSNLMVPGGGHSHLPQGPKHYYHQNLRLNSFLIPDTCMKNTPPPNLRDSTFLPTDNFCRPIRGRQNPLVNPQVSRSSKALRPRKSVHTAPNVASCHSPFKFNFPDPALISNKNETNIPPQAQSNLHEDSSVLSDASERIGDGIPPQNSRNSSEAMTPGKNLNPELNDVSDPLPRDKQRSTLIPNINAKNIPPPTDHLLDSSLSSDGDAVEQTGDQISPEDPQISAKSKNESKVKIPIIRKFSFPNSNLIPSINVENIAPSGRDSPLIPLDGTELSEEEQKKFGDTRILTEDYFKKLNEEKLIKLLYSSGSEESSVQSSISQIFLWTDLFPREVPSESSESKLEVPSESPQEVRTESQQEESLVSELEVPSESPQEVLPEYHQEESLVSKIEVPPESQHEESLVLKLEVSSESSNESKQEVPPELQQEKSLVSKLEVPLESSTESKQEVPPKSQQKESPEESKLEVSSEFQQEDSLVSKLEVPSESPQEFPLESQQEESLVSKLEVPLESSTEPKLEVLPESQQKESPEESKLEVSSEFQQEDSLVSKLDVPLESQQKESPEESKLEIPSESQVKVSTESNLEVPSESQQKESLVTKPEVPLESQPMGSLQSYSESPAIEVSCQHGYKLTFTLPYFPMDTNSFKKRTTPALESDYFLDFETTNLMDNGYSPRSILEVYSK